MEGLFIGVLNISLTASLFVLAVAAVRLLFKKAPKSLVCLLWALVGIRLIFPFSIESAFSFSPTAQPIPSDIIYSDEPFVESGIEFIDQSVNDLLSEEMTGDSVSGVTPVGKIISVSAILWLCGIALMLGYLAFSYFRVRFSVKEAVKDDKGIWICDRIGAPFIFGVFSPRIYLPSELSGEDKWHVIAHEKAHLKRLDYIWKPIGYVLLTVYWFNPVIWLGYILLCRDIEYACDEKVVKTLGEEGRKSYSEALVNCSSQRRLLTVCPLAFGEVGVKKRIVSVLNYKKPAFWVVLAAIVAAVATVLLFMTNRPQGNLQDSEHTHSWEYLSVTKYPTCTEEGSRVKVCSECKAEEIVTLKALGHSLYEPYNGGPTCTEPGYTNYRKCSVCDYETKHEIAPLGHDFGVFRKCDRCGYVSEYSPGLRIVKRTAVNEYCVMGRGSNTEVEVDIPPEYNGMPVTQVLDTFHEDYSIVKVTLPDCINNIGAYTFSEAFRLKEVNMGNGVRFIGDNAFAECVSLKNIDLSDSLTNIGAGAFRWCYKLESIVIPKTVKRIKYAAFDNCSSLNYAVFEDPEGWGTDVDLTDPYEAAQWLKTLDEKRKN